MQRAERHFHKITAALAAALLLGNLAGARNHVFTVRGEKTCLDGQWLRENNYRNVFVDVDNEGMALAAKGLDNRQMVLSGKAQDPRCVIATNFRGEPPAEADLAIHHSRQAAGKPYIETEASPGNAPGGYWGAYSKREGYYNYINIGVYTNAMKAEQIEQTKAHLSREEGYMLASTWLQCVPPYGPNHTSGGDGTPSNPGIKWWLEFLRDTYGPYIPGR